jgi:hypothetical protein
MGAADDIKKGLTEGLKKWTKQQKAEEKSSSAAHWRASRLKERRGKFLSEAFDEVIVDCYMKVSDNNSLPAHARQLFYKARPPIEEATDKQLSYFYFSQTLLPDYISNNPGLGWDVVYDDRGHFEEPHGVSTFNPSQRNFGLGTLNVRNYLRSIGALEFKGAGYAPAEIKTHGPSGNFGALLYIEKEGFMPLFEKVELAQRFDLAMMSSKGFSATAAWRIAEGICSEHGVPLLILHDFDKSGVIIADTLTSDTRRYQYSSPPHVIDLGLTFDDIEGLASEDPGGSNIGEDRLKQAGLSDEAIEFLNNERVELNAMTSRELVEFVEAKLEEINIGKVVPDTGTLKQSFEMFAKGQQLKQAFGQMQKKLTIKSVEVPRDLQQQVDDMLEEYPEISWHKAIHWIVDPDAEEEENKESDENDDDIDDYEGDDD